MNNDYKKAMGDERVQKAINSLDPQKRERLNSILNNEKELEKIMNTPQAQLLLKKLLEQ